MKTNLIIGCGLAGVGKTTHLKKLAEALNQIASCEYIDKDDVNIELGQEFDLNSDFYKTEIAPKTYQIIAGRAKQHIAEGKIVILDGYYGNKLTALPTKDLLLSDQIIAKVIYFHCSSDKQYERLIKRGLERDSDKLGELFTPYRRQHLEDHVRELAQVSHLMIDTEKNEVLVQNIEQISRYIQEATISERIFFKKIPCTLNEEETIQCALSFNAAINKHERLLRSVEAQENPSSIKSVSSTTKVQSFQDMSSNTIFFRTEKISSSMRTVQSFVETHYPTLTLHTKMFEQLLWLQNNSVNTSQSHVHAKQDVVNIEVKRMLSRLHSFKLLIEGGAFAYSTFTQSQTAGVALSKDNFDRLSNFIQSLAPASRECLMATCFITKSDQAIMAVPAERKKDLPTDSEQFITYMAIYFPKKFPICALLTQEAIDLLPYAFYKNSHARQMLDMEGGYNMLSNMKEAIRTRKITYEQYNLWFARWILNIAGLDGHVHYEGSSYLTEPLANCIWALKLELDQLWFNPNYNVIDNYLAFRKNQLAVNDNYIAYLAALMRQYNSSKGLEIQAWFKNLSTNDRQEKIKIFKRQLEQTKVTSTFKPTVLVNLMDLGCLVSIALEIFTEIESEATRIYDAAIDDDRILKNTPLSYRNVADKKSLLSIKDYYERNNRIPELIIDSGGYLNVTTDALQEKTSLKSAV